jgi:hypothetical protein
MERVFSVEEIPNPYWVPPHPQSAAAGAVAAPAGEAAGLMNRCPSEWYFQKFLEEAVLDSPVPVAGASRGSVGAGVEAAESKTPGAAAPAAASSSVVDPVEYNAMLKQKLEKDLAAVALWRVCSLAFSCNSSAMLFGFRMVRLIVSCLRSYVVSPWDCDIHDAALAAPQPHS